MSEPELPGIPKPPWRERLRRLFNRRQWPAWAIGLYLVITEVPDWRHRLDFWLDTAESVNPYLGIVAAVLSSGYFRWGLFGAAVGYLILVGEPRRGVQRHHWWPYLAWTVLAICVTAVIITAGVGYFELRVRKAISQAPLGSR
jgi:hypothetical protein